MEAGTASSGNALIAIIGGFTLLACVGCGAADRVEESGPAHATESVVTTRTVTASTTPAVPDAAERSATVGPPILDTEATARLPIRRGMDILQPVASYGEDILVSITPTEDPSGATPQRFELWDPKSGAFSAAWTGTPGQQDIIGGVDGDWVATVRTTTALPFADWTIIVRNLRSGETYPFAQGDPVIANNAQLHPDLPMGLAPLPSVSGTKVVWEEWRRDGETVAKRVMLADLADGHSEVLASTPDATRHDLRLPVIEANTVAWVTRDFGAKTAGIQVYDLTTKTTRTLDTGGNPWNVALYDRGNSIAWDDGLQAKYTESLAGGERTRFATQEGWGVVSNGRQISWTPAGAQGGSAGYFDPAENIVRLLPGRQGERTNVALVAGPWFVWQELKSGADNQPTADSAYYFLPLPRSG